MKKCFLYGDSLTCGFNPDGGHKGATYPEELRYTGILRRELKDWEFIINAKPGRCIPSMDFELEEFYSALEKVGEIELFAIMLGTNDYLSYSKPDSERVADRMRNFLKRLFEKESYSSGRTKILLIAPPCLNFVDDRYYKRFTTLDGELSKAMRKLADELKIYFADAGSIPLPVSKDGIHLTLEAQKPLGEYLVSVLKGIS